MKMKAGFCVCRGSVVFIHSHHWLAAIIQKYLKKKMVHFICAGREGDFPDMSVLNGFCYL
ncbi:hypothetical protein DVI44_003808 [Escherichia coli]|nr:hypothetical protein [Escherichia coli]ELW2534613.1 hypothetical protein [Escherichia coli O157]EEC9727904.1 hypothetical protein [Escherichia coli]EEX9488061.1 hypothetical protein [Escherichia coli]EFC5445233.1 hypothetical protein [Escherichia coli]